MSSEESHDIGHAESELPGTGDAHEVHLDTPPSETSKQLAKPTPSPSPSPPSSSSSTLPVDARSSIHSASSKELTPVPSNVTSKDPTPTGTPALSALKSTSGHGVNATAASAAVTAHALAEGPSGRRSSMSSGSYQSSRPAPPSPAPSRRASGIGFAARDRASSGASSSSAVGSASGHGHGHLAASSSSGGSTLRRPSNSSNGPGSRPQSRIRPRSSLGTSYLTAEAMGIPPDQISPAAGTSTSSSGSKLSDTPVLEGEEPSGSRGASPETSLILSAPPVQEIPVTIRDYAYPTSDDRYRGIPAPISASTSRQGSGPIWHPRAEPPRKASTASTGSASSRDGGDGRRPSAGFTFGGFSFGNDDSGSPGGSSSGKEGKKGWTGLNLLGWRGFLGRKPSTGGLSSNSEEPSPSAEEEIDIVPPDDYAFESSSSDAGDDGDDDSRFGVNGVQETEEPKGLYKVAYTFEAEGEHEVGVEEGEVVLAKGRGGGEGWVIAVRVRRGTSAASAGAEEATAGGTGEISSVHSTESADPATVPSTKNAKSDSGSHADRIEGLIPEGYLEPLPSAEEGQYTWMWEYEDEASASPYPPTAKEALMPPSELDLGGSAVASENGVEREKEEGRVEVSPAKTRADGSGA